MTTDATRATAKALPEINRRNFLFKTASAGAVVAVAAPAYAAEPGMTPDERIDTAVEEIRLAFREKWPNCPIRIEDCDNGNNGMLLILTHVGEDEPGTVKHNRLGTARVAKGGAA